MHALASDFAHWHSFQGELPADEDDRALMGMSLVKAAALRREDPSELAELADLPPLELARVVESPDASLHRRLLAGQLLALLGDPRVDVRHPRMQAVPAGEVSIGLETLSTVVLERFTGLGLRPAWIDKERPAHRVVLRAFHIGRYPVTHGEYAAFVAASGHAGLPSAWPQGRMPAYLANHPVHTVSHDDAVAYTRWLRDETGLAYRLPTESEWEHAARGTDDREFPWGDAFLPDHANTVESGLFASTPVGAFPRGASPYGCLDMAGNVEEWVQDLYAAYPGGMAVVDDLADCPWPHHVARGGSFTRFRDLARTRRRHGRYRRNIYVMGFRLALDGLS